ncbi:MAG TPA: DUF2333 family protein [Candidatus Margulisiibacteriota bacterium]|nr:DUF2333 family protein [Candidatus Margulisiibacteriota bacterium]
MADAGNGVRRWLIGGAVVMLIVVVGGPLVLHFGQKRHDVLAFNVAQAFPADKPIVGGEVFATTLMALMEHELNGITGWRPNDFFLWGPHLWADNNANRQLAIIQALRESVRVLKDHLTKVSSNEFDRNLVEADTDFRNDAERLWLPSAESKFREGVRHLQAYVDGLKTTPPTSRPINQRNMELLRLFQAWGDLLGDAHARLYKEPESAWDDDDDFYHAQGFAHVIHYLALAIGREYQHAFETKPVVHTLLNEVADALGQAATLKPLIVFDGRPDGLLANHRRNLDAYIAEARQKLYSIREELEK